MRRPALLLVTIALAACGDDTKTTTIKGENGETVSVTQSQDDDGVTNLEATSDKGEKYTANIGGTGGTWPADAPAFAAPYPGATITSVMSSTGGGKSGSIIIFETPDAPAKVIDHYKALATSAGLPQVATMTSGGMTMFSAADDSRGEVVIQASTAEGKTSTAVTYSTKAG